MISFSTTGERRRKIIFAFPLVAPVVATLFCGCKSVSTAHRDDLGPILQKSGKFNRILQSPEKFRLQVLISEVVPEKDGKVKLHRHGYRLGAEYFYPASTVKLCGAVAALQAIEKLQAASGSPDLFDVPLEIAPLFPGDLSQKSDPDNQPGGKITVKEEIRKLALVSDNQAFNRLFDLVGHEALNRQMHELGLNSVVINHRLSEPRQLPDPTATAAVEFFPTNGNPVQIPARTSTLVLTNTGRGLQVGIAQMVGSERVERPMDFTRRNGITVLDLQNLLIKLVRPDIDLGTPTLWLAPAHREALLRAMTEFPRESKNPLYPAEKFPDSYCKFLLPGVRRVFPSAVPGVRIDLTGKTGQAYGFTIENTCLRNPKNGRIVFVSAVIYANSDGILNDDKYDYATVALPFMADLGEFVVRRWLSGD